jgi:hypothetical protein
MSEDYKKIALEDVEKGQRIRVVEWYPSHIAMYEGKVLKTRLDQGEVDLGEEVGDEVTIFADDSHEYYILLLEDAPKPKIVRTETVTITHYDDGTKTEVKAPMVIKTMDQFGEYEDYLKQVVLKDRAGDYWMYRDGQWNWSFASSLPGAAWRTAEYRETLEDSLPLTVVENVGD